MGTRSVAEWILPTVMLAAMLGLIATDFGNLATIIRGFERDAYQAFVPSAREVLSPRPAQVTALAILAVAGFVIVTLFLRASPISAATFAVVTVLGTQALSVFLYVRERVLLDTATPNAALIVVFLAGLFGSVLGRAHNRRALHRAFSHRLPAAVASEIARAPSLLKLDAEIRTVTSLSCGVRHWPALGASLAPADFHRLVNTVLVPLMDEAVNAGAMVSPLHGEGFTACWNAPLNDPRHARRACEAASLMTATLAKLDEQLLRAHRPDGVAPGPLEIDIGIATGPAMTGGFGSPGRLRYAVMGGNCARADRLRALADRYGHAVIVSDATRDAAGGEFAFLELDSLPLAQGEGNVRVYGLLGNPLTHANPKFRALATFHDRIFELLRARQWDDARRLIDQCRKLSGASQKLYELYLARIAWIESHAPGADWDGGFVPPPAA